MPTTVIVRQDLLSQIIADPKVRAALRSIADDLAPSVRRIALEVGAVAYAESVAREGGTRPGTKSAQHIRRPYERVLITARDAAAREWGDVGVQKQAILARAIAAAGAAR